MSDTDTTEKSPGDTFNELKEMLVTYTKQETISPLKNLGIWVAWGLAGALAMTIGIVLLAVGLLRLLQEEVGWDADYGSVVPYLIVVGALLALAAVAGYAAAKTKTEETQP